MPNSKLRVSVVIPVYNEEKRIKPCLKALMTQTVKPYEIIIVDNNCTDKTIEIVKKNRKIKIVKESFQGMAAARTKGFNVAKGDILARIDADTILPPDWIAQVIQQFRDDPELAGLSGYGIVRAGSNIPKCLWRSMSIFWSRVYFTHCRAFFGVDILWGSNMAIRQSVWMQIKDLCMTNNNDIHEDQDLSLAIASIGGIIKINPNLLVSVNFYETEHFGKYWHYLMMKRRGRKLHKAHSRSRLPTMRKINPIKRCWFFIITLPLHAIYNFYTLFNSATRLIATLLKKLFTK